MAKKKNDYPLLEFHDYDSNNIVYIRINAIKAISSLQATEKYKQRTRIDIDDGISFLVKEKAEDINYLIIRLTKG